MDLEFIPGSALGKPRPTSTGTAHATEMGVLMVSAQYRHIEPITPSGTAQPHTIDAITVSVDSNVTLVTADDPAAAAVLIPMKAGTIYPIACSKVTIVSTGTAFALFHRKPS